MGRRGPREPASYIRYDTISGIKVGIIREDLKGLELNFLFSNVDTPTHWSSYSSGISASWNNKKDKEVILKILSTFKFIK